MLYALSVHAYQDGDVGDELGEYIPNTNNRSHEAIVVVRPEYPPAAIKQHISGEVVVIFDVTREGLTENIRILKSSNSIFEDNVLRVVKLWKYIPSIVDGVPTKVSDVKKTIKFDIKNNDVYIE